ncbi:MAG: 2TM domain-containing protein [Acidimicrobiia bacterium]
MTVAHPTQGGRSDRTGGSPGWQFTEWLLGIVGGIGAFLGLFILFAGDDEYVGIGGDWSWRVGEVSTTWAYGLLIGGGLLVLAALVMVVSGRDRPAHTSAGDRDRAGLWWHVGIFVAVNTFIWVQDIAIGDGVNYAYWITIPWAIGLAIHTATYRHTRRTTE